MIRSPYLPWFQSFLAFTLLVGFAFDTAAASNQSPVASVNASKGIGIKGYDPAAYFTLGRPVSGSDQYTAEWKGVTYRFASAADLEMFKADPEKYLPQYGGYCAYAMSINRIADIDPSRWAIVNNKLYLNNNFLSFHLWSLDKDNNIVSADRNWSVFPKKTSVEERDYSNAKNGAHR